VRNLPFRDILPMMLPLKKIRYLDVEVMVPNNPIAFLEKVFEQGNDVGSGGMWDVGLAGSERVC
jgi:hypothetical protein